MFQGEHTYFKKAWLLIIFFLLLFPTLQSKYKVFQFQKLNGSFPQTERPVFSKESWLKGDYQTQLRHFLAENIGFKNALIRFNNQLLFSLFKQANANSVIVGKQNYIYEESYIDSYLGNDFIGDSAVKEKVRKLKSVKDSLKKKNISLILVIAPGKGHFYPEYIPDRFINGDSLKTNYEAFLPELTKHEIPYIDFNDFFKQSKKIADYPLYPQAGIHWSSYGVVSVMDSMIKFIEREKAIRLPQLRVKDTEISSLPKEADNDGEKGMNLLTNFSTETLAYPSIEFEKKDAEKVKSLVIADSFYWMLYGKGFSAEVFDDGQFWFYNEQIYQPSIGFNKDVEDLKFKTDEVEKNDIVVLLQTEASLFRLGFGFIEAVYEEYTDVELIYKRKVNKYRNDILNNPEWLNKIKESAEKENRKLEEEISLHAKYMVSIESNN